MGLLRWLDHWTYERSYTNCERCGKKAFCYFGVCWPEGHGNRCGMGCPSCKKEQDERRVKEIECLRRAEEMEEVAPVVNRRAAVMATRLKYG